LYHSTFIARAGPKYKGRISRFLANKCSIASRIDCFSGKSFYDSISWCNTHGPFSDNPTPKFGEALRAQVEERLAFFDSGAPPSRNADALRKIVEELEMENDEEEEEDNTGMDVDEPALTTLEAEPQKEKKRKRKNDDMDVDDDDHSSKKVKLSKEEKKLLKKAKKEKAKAEAAANGTKNVGSFFT